MTYGGRVNHAVYHHPARRYKWLIPRIAPHFSLSIYLHYILKVSGCCASYRGGTGIAWGHFIRPALDDLPWPFSMHPRVSVIYFYFSLSCSEPSITIYPCRACRRPASIRQDFHFRRAAGFLTSRRVGECDSAFSSPKSLPYKSHEVGFHVPFAMVSDPGSVIATYVLEANSYIIFLSIRRAPNGISLATSYSKVATLTIRLD
ncbi:hypothetical protein BJV78DRAFT_369173 [Lactifluus subvellereus]|nr:hypothetical protein BJV78DRAFT_369173 [Lactifluus subvellereus]